MSESYAREILKRNVAQICQTIGWNGINSTPLDILMHVLEKYICTLGTQANRYAEQFNRNEPNLNDLGLVFRDLNIQLPELTEYTSYVPPVPPPDSTEKFPKSKESNLNFLKPGSNEVLTRPMHVHEYLPPMYPDKEQETPAVADIVEIKQNGIDNVDSSNTNCGSPEISVTDSPDKSKDVFKRPGDPISLPNSKRPRLRLDEEERTREISSVMMTMSGFLSPAREGKLPEARAPTVVSEKHEKHKVAHQNPIKVPSIDKTEKKSKKNKLLNGKVMKSKRKDKSHKGESSKSKDSNKLIKIPSGYPGKNKDIHPTQLNHVTVPTPKVFPPPQKTGLSPALVPMPIMEHIKPIIKQEPVEPINKSLSEDALPVPRKIPINKSPLVNPNPLNKQVPCIGEPEIKREILIEEEKLSSQPDRSKINIFKRISNKSKEERNTPEVVPDKSQESLNSRLHNSQETSSNRFHDLATKPVNSHINNNDSVVDYSKEIDLRTNEVISLDDDSSDFKPKPAVHRPSISINKSLQVPFPKEINSVTPKVKKEKKHKEKKDKAAKLEMKLLKKQQLALEMAKANSAIIEECLKLSNTKSKSSKPKIESKMPQLPPGFPFFPGLPPGRGMMPGPGLIPNADFLAFANNPALRGLHPPNLLNNPFSPGLIPGGGFLPGGLGPGMPNPLMSMANFSHSSKSSSSKIPPILRRPSLEVIPVDHDDDRTHKPSLISRDKDRHDKHKSTIPNILQKHKNKLNKELKNSNAYKMPPIHPDITIELNPPKPDLIRQEPPKQNRVPSPIRTPTPQSDTLVLQPPEQISPQTIKQEILPLDQIQDLDKSDKKKDKAHKKEKKDKDGLKIKKKKDKKDKNKEKSEKKREKEEKLEIKEELKKIKKEKKIKKKEKLVDGLVPKLTLKLNSSNSNSPMPPSSPEHFKLNIKPVVKKDEVTFEPEESSFVKDETISRENSRSPELAQISALVTRPPKLKHSKHNNVLEPDVQVSSPPPSVSSPARKNRPPSSHSKYKRIFIKPLSKKGMEPFDDEVISLTDEAMPTSEIPIEKTAGGTLPTPYYLDDHGNKIWVCPACGRPDNGSPMIGCDGCDGWYHWVCVGITEEPGATEDWFCKSCVAKREALVLAGVPTSVKKRGRKPKGEKIRDCH